MTKADEMREKIKERELADYNLLLDAILRQIDQAVESDKREIEIYAVMLDSVRAKLIAEGFNIRTDMKNCRVRYVISW